MLESVDSTVRIQPESRCEGCMEPVSGPVCAICGWTRGMPPDTPLSLLPRTILAGKYLLGRMLGCGGFGITYLALDLNLDRKLAIKEYFPRSVATRDTNHQTVLAINTQSKGAFDHGLAKFLAEGLAL